MTIIPYIWLRTNSPRPSLLFLLWLRIGMFNDALGCYSLSFKNGNESSPQRPVGRRRGFFPLFRITGDGTPYKFPCTEISFRQEWSNNWPFTKNDFARIDYYNDGLFYALPRLVYHVDEPAVCALTQHYRRSIEKNSDILDICSSWVSHYPTEFPETMNSIRATGMNPIELFFNDQLTDGFVVADLNGDDIINKPSNAVDEGIDKAGRDLFAAYDDESFDVVTCALSIDYLIDPVKVLRGCNRILRSGGKVIVSFSNRCFGTKAIRVWRLNKNSFHVELVNAFFKFAGNYKTPTAYEITPTIPDKTQKFRDPLFVIEAVKR